MTDKRCFFPGIFVLSKRLNFWGVPCIRSLKRNAMKWPNTLSQRESSSCKCPDEGARSRHELEYPEGIIEMPTGKFLLVYLDQVNQVNNCLVFLHKQENLKACKIIPYLRGGLFLKRWAALFLFKKITGMLNFLRNILCPYNRWRMSKARWSVAGQNGEESCRERANARKLGSGRRRRRGG